MKHIPLSTSVYDALQSLIFNPNNPIVVVSFNVSRKKPAMQQHDESSKRANTKWRVEI